MDSADRSSNQRSVNTSPSRDLPAGNRSDRAARVAALEARIRELRAQASVNAGAEGTGSASDEAIDTKTQASNATVSSALLALKRSIRKPGLGRVPSAPVNAAGHPLRSQSKRSRSAPSPTVRNHFALIHKKGCSLEKKPGPTAADLLKALPSWLTSAVVHCFLLVTFALLTWNQTEFLPTIVIAGSTTEPILVPDITTPPEIADPSSDTADRTWNADELVPDLMQPGSPLELPSPDQLATITAFGKSADQPGAAARMAGSDEGGGAQFYGIQATGDRFVFVVDSSTSMRVKFAEAKRELEYAIRRLGKNQQFYVIFFDRGAKRLRLGKWNRKHTRYLVNSRPAPDLVRPTTENIDALIHWMNSIQLEADTNPHPAVVFALNKLRPDAIFLLSDGEFYDDGATESFLLRENFLVDSVAGRRPKTIVHCVGFYSRQGEITLQRIAKANGGTYRFVEPPWVTSR